MHKHGGQTCCQRGDGGGNGLDGEYGIGKCKLFHLEWLHNEVLLYSIGNYIQCPRIELDGR